jgi:hypothetical protein
MEETALVSEHLRLDENGSVQAGLKPLHVKRTSLAALTRRRS